MKREHGFTFIEVILAVALMAAASSLIIGLQTSSLWRTVRDRNGQQGSLSARRILAMIEAQDGELGGSEYSGSAADVLQELGYQFSSQNEDRQELSRFQVKISVQPWEIPAIGPDSMQKIQIDLSWGPGPDDRIEYLYFTAKD